MNHRGNPDRTSHLHTIGYFREDAVRLIRMFAMHTKKDGLLFPPVEVDWCMRKGRLFFDFWLVLLGDV